MTKGDEIAAMVADAEKEFGAIDILVNNAGIQYVAPIDEFPVDKWDAIIAINLSSAFHATRAALPKMQARGWGRIINIASAHALVASPFKSAYVAAKHGVGRPHQDDRAGDRAPGITCQLPSAPATSGRRWSSQIPDHHEEAQQDRRGGQARRSSSLSSRPRVRHRRAGRGAGAVPDQRGGQVLNGALLSTDGGWTAA